MRDYLKQLVRTGMVVASLFTTGAFAAEWSVEQLMSSLADAKSGQTRFTEKKHLAILDAPIKSSGTLSFTAPSRLEKHVTSPIDERYLVDGDTVLVENKAKGINRTFALQTYPAVWAFVQSFQATLTGNLEQLRRFYDVALSGSKTRWELVLTPKLPEMAQRVKQMQIKGSGDRIATITIRETGGDYSVMTLEESKP